MQDLLNSQSNDEIDLLCARAAKALDETLAGLKFDGLMQ